jgi:glutathione S-transferase
MTLTFYYAPMSTAGITEAVLAELAIPHDRVKLDITASAASARDTRKPSYLKINPNARVPAIVHDGTPIWESAAITIYLGEVFGVEAGLYPPLSPKRGEAMKWIVWSNVTLAEAASRLAMAQPCSSMAAATTDPASLDWVPSELRSEAAGVKASKDLGVCFKVLDDALEDNDNSFLVGDYTLADTHVNSIVGWVTMLKFDLKPYPSVEKWAKCCSERPAIAKMWA